MKKSPPSESQHKKIRLKLSLLFPSSQVKVSSPAQTCRAKHSLPSTIREKQDKKHWEDRKKHWEDRKKQGEDRKMPSTEQPKVVSVSGKDTEIELKSQSLLGKLNGRKQLKPQLN